ncbi:TetR/AcrR family transcriptional regulator [Altererythrobacter sp. BO-6]|uniref:TetR/AcrR family transcriptional regulator n=1 Tax=Altererythrobacter sp. BO-6 TaxID=2604537 RepID=UPI0013E1D35A|nr:TetR/AcrR family transcriptional regulator [Altererythrobacter sp. BO-6]QIG53054.1 TetR/AcrR family transcriptional regulator [Altererythrobacter sp. BO-6]
MDNLIEKSGSRAETRQRILGVFNRLLLEGASPRPAVAQVIAEAGIARSTFYDHFDGIEALSNESLANLFGALADSLIADHNDAMLVPLLEHVWQNRGSGRDLILEPRGHRTEALLAHVIEQRSQVLKDRRLKAILIAGTVFSAIAGWVSGRISTPPEEMARTLRRATSAILAEA